MSSQKAFLEDGGGSAFWHGNDDGMIIVTADQEAKCP